jgi:hypothetical protein
MINAVMAYEPSEMLFNALLQKSVSTNSNNDKLKENGQVDSDEKAQNREKAISPPS